MDNKEEKRITQKKYYWRKQGFNFSSIEEIEAHKSQVRKQKREAYLAKNREKARAKREEIKKALEYYKQKISEGNDEL